MGPFVPELISDQLNLIVALILGIGFGFVLEQAGFSSSRRLAGVFYGYDFTVLRVFFTAAVTAMSGVFLLGYFGVLDTAAIFVNPTWLLPAIVGGAIMGLGFILGGYCPGTSVCAAAIGKVDGMFFVGGGLLGVLLFGELYPLYKGFYESTSLGAVTVYDSLGLSRGLFAFILIVVAVGAFAVTTMIEKRVNKNAAPSFAFTSGKHYAAAAAVLLLGVVFLMMSDREEYLIGMVSDPTYAVTRDVRQMDVDELAYRILDRAPKMQIIDIRPAADFARTPLPASLNIPLKEFFRKDWIPLFSQRHTKKVIVAQEEMEGRSAALLLEELGYENVAVLKGGFGEFEHVILQGTDFHPAGTRWDADVSAFRQKARTSILQMIAESKNAKPSGAKKEKKIQGGC